MPDRSDMQRIFLIYLARFHFLFLHLLPFLAILSFCLADSSKITLIVLAGFPAYAVYNAFLCSSYRLTTHFRLALQAALLTPLILTLTNFFQGNLGIYLVEQTLVEAGSLIAGLLLVMLRYHPTGRGGAIVILLVAAGFLYPFGLATVELYQKTGFHWLKVLGMLVSFVIATDNDVRLFASKAAGLQKEDPKLKVGDDTGLWEEFISPFELKESDFAPVLVGIFAWLILPFLMDYLI